MPSAPRPSAPGRSPAARAVTLLLASGWAAGVAALCAAKYRAALYTDFDLAIFTQALYGALRGQWFVSIRGMHWLGDHSSLSLLLLAPLAAFLRSPLLLVDAQVVALAAGAWPVFAYARRRLGDERAAAACAALWLLQPALGYLATFEFHPETFATPALLGVAAALAARRGRVAIACAALAALAREDVALPLAVTGVVALLRPRSGVRGAGLAILGVAAGSLALSFLVLKPLLAHGEAAYGAMYAAWGDSPRAIATNLLAHPLQALAALVHAPDGDAVDTLVRRQLWLHLFGPVAGLALLAPWTLLPALPVLAEHVLSYRVEQHTIIYQYTALTLPYVVLASVDAVAWLARRGGAAAARVRGRTAALLGAALLTALAGQAAFGPLAPDTPLRAHRPSERLVPDGRDRALAAWRRSFERRLPPGPVVVDFPSLAPLALRDSVHSLHHVAAGRYTFSSRAYPAPERCGGLLLDTGALVEAGTLDADALDRVRAFAATRHLHPADAAGDLLLFAPSPAETLDTLDPAPEPAHAHAVHYAGGLEFVGGTVAPDAPAGGRLAVTTLWRRTGALEHWPLMEWCVEDADGGAREQAPRLLGYGLSPVATWPVGGVWAEHYRWVVPADLVPGTYTLAFSLLWGPGEATPVAETSDPDVRAAGGRVPIGRFRVTPAR